jgi:FkbH-like protein
LFKGVTEVNELSQRINGLSPAKQKLLELHLKKQQMLRDMQISKEPALTPVSRNEQMPLSFLQEGIWTVEQLEPGKSVFNLPVTLKLTGQLNLTVLEQSINEIVRRHEALRTTFALRNGQLIQLVVPSLTLTLLVVNLRQLAAQEREAEQERLSMEEAYRPFDLVKGPLLRVTLLHLDEEDYVLLVTMHHAVSDAWSLGIFIQELSVIYQAFLIESPYALPQLPIQYADFAHWQRQYLQGEVLEAQLSYWKQQLNDVPALQLLPLLQSSAHRKPDLVLRAARERVPTDTFNGSHQSLVIPKNLVEELRELSQREGVTLFMTLLSAFKILLYHYTGQEQVSVRSPILNRNHAETEGLIGAFAVPLILSTTLSENITFQDLLVKVREVTLGAYAHPNMPLNYNILTQVLFDFTKEPADVINLPNLTLSIKNKIGFLNIGGIDLFSYLAEIKDKEGLYWALGYNTDLFEAETIKHLMDSYLQILKACVQHPEETLTQFHLSKQLEANLEKAREPQRQQVIAIASTFTAEPLKESLSFWMKEIDISSKIVFAPYNQVFQQLLDPASLLAQNQDGINIVLVRFDDWVRFENRAGGAGGEKIVENQKNLVLALKQAAARTATPYLVCLCPAAPETVDGDAALLQQMEAQMVADLADVSGVYLVTTTELATTYPVATFYDPHTDELGHVPFTPLFFSTLGTMLARKIYTIQRTAYKVIVLDCDQTLWQGVCGEDGADGIVIDQPRQALQEFMVAQHDSGMLLCLCSKNNSSDVLQVFERHPQMPLQREHLVSMRINWQPKSENLKSLAQELQLGLDSFIFIDDNPVDCAEVRANCPEVLTLQLPEDPHSIPRFLQHIWAFDRLTITAEDKQRTSFYQQNIERQQVLRESLTLRDFLSSLNLQVQITEMTPLQVARVSQLTQRTNQFNTTTIRRSEGEIQTLCQLEKYTCLVVEVKDRFGDYGLVGVMLFAVTSDALEVDTLLLSCRVLGRGVEHQMLAKLGKIALNRGRHRLDVTYKPTSKNQPILDFLNCVGAQFKEKLENDYSFRLPAAFCQEIAYNPELTPNHKLPIQHFTSAPGVRANSALLNRIAMELYDPEQIFQSLDSEKRLTPNGKIDRRALPIVAPRTPTEEMLARIWAEVLGVEQVGVYDNFFELGGHSLQAIQVISRVREAFCVDLPVSRLFEEPTIAGVAERIEAFRITSHELQVTTGITAGDRESGRL